MTDQTQLLLAEAPIHEAQQSKPAEEVKMIVEPEVKWRMSPSIGKLAEALAKAQAKFDPVLKDSDNPFYKSRYADLATVIEATRKHLASEGIAIIQMPHANFNGEATLVLTTLMVHSSGEWITSELTLPAMMKDRIDAQSVGSAITYARRYTLSAMTGVAQQDDDANAAVGIGTKEAAQGVAKRKIAQSTGADASEPMSILPFKEGQLAVTGNSLALLRADLTDEEKLQIRMKWSGTDKTWLLVEADGNLFASIAEKHGYKVIWKD